LVQATREILVNFQPPPGRGTFASHRLAVPFPQRRKDSRLNVDSLLAGGLRGIIGYQRVGIISRAVMGLPARRITSTPDL
jgi:hypothetical protein